MNLRIQVEIGKLSRRDLYDAVVRTMEHFMQTGTMDWPVLDSEGTKIGEFEISKAENEQTYLAP